MRRQKKQKRSGAGEGIDFLFLALKGGKGPQDKECRWLLEAGLSVDHQQGKNP